MNIKDNLKQLFWHNKSLALSIKPLRKIQNLLSKDFPYLIKDISTYKKYYIKHNESIIPDNNYYSINTVLNKLDIPINDVVCEHGLYFGDYFPDKLKDGWINSVVTFSKFRGDIIKANNKKPIIIGPYIHYVEPVNDSYYEEDYFLVIMSHTTKGLILKEKYNFQEYITSLEKKFGLKSLLLVHPNEIDQMENYFLNWTTCGFKEDNYYLKRLKRLIIDSNFVVTDFIGTHLGYVNLLNKDIFSIKQAFEPSGSKKDLKKEFGSRLESNLYLNQISKLNKEMKDESFIKSELFDKLIYEYWGFQYLR